MARATHRISGRTPSRNTWWNLGLNASGLHPSVCWHAQRHITVLVHVDDRLCISESADLRWLPGALQKEYVLNRVLRRGSHGFGWECAPKRARTSVREFQGCNGKDPPITKDGPEKSMEGGQSEPERAGKT